MLKLLLPLIFAAVAAAQPLVTVSGYMLDAGGNPRRGEITVTWPTFINGSQTVVAGSLVLRPSSTGFVSVNLYPQTYTVIYRLTGGATTTLGWVIPPGPPWTQTITAVQTPPPGVSPTVSGIVTINARPDANQLLIKSSPCADYTITSATNTHTFTIPYASSTNCGLLSAADWATFNAAAGGGDPSLGGDLSGTASAAVVAKINGAPLGTTTPTSGRLLIANGTQWASVAMSGDATINSAGSVTVGGTSAATPGTIVRRDGSGSSNFFIVAAQVGNFVPTIGATAMTTYRGTAGQTLPIQIWADEFGNQLAGMNADGTGDFPAMHKVRKNSTGSVFTRSRYNFIEGSNVTLTVTDDAGNDEVDITIAASGAGGGGSINTVNGENGPDITLAVGTAGSDFALAITADTVTFNLPSASTTARGVVTTGTQSFAGAKTFTNEVIIEAADGVNVLRIKGNPTTNPSCVNAGQASIYASSSGSLFHCQGTTADIPIGNVTSPLSGQSGQVAYFSAEGNIQGVGVAEHATAGSFSIAQRTFDGDLVANNFIGAKYQTVQEEGTPVTQRPSINFIGGGVTCVDDAGNTRTNCTISTAAAYATIQDEGTPLTQRTVLDFTGTGVSCADSGGTKTLCTINTGGGGGNVSSGGSSTTDYLVNWANASGTLVGSGVCVETLTTTGGCIVRRDSSGAANLYDKGAYVYNVKAFGAAGTGGNDSTAIVNALADCENSTYGGRVVFPAGIYGVDVALVQGNGSSTGAGAPSSKANCYIEGIGYDTELVTGKGAIIRWIGSNPGSNTYIFKRDGPILGGGIENITFDCADNTNMIGVDMGQSAFSYLRNVSIIRCGGGTAGGAFNLRYAVTKTYDYFACFNRLDNVQVRTKIGGGGSALWMGGDSSLGTACGNLITGGYFNRDNNYTSGTNFATYSVLQDSADNNRFEGVHFSNTGGNGLRNGCTIGAEAGEYAPGGTKVYPDSSTFVGISSNGACGKVSDITNGRPWYFLNGGECGADGQGSCDFHNAFTGGGTKPVAMTGEAFGDRNLKGLATLQVTQGVIMEDRTNGYGQRFEWYDNNNILGLWSGSSSRDVYTIDNNANAIYNGQSTGGNNVYIKNYGATGTVDRPGLHLFHNCGTLASPADCSSGTRMGTFNFGTRTSGTERFLAGIDGIAETISGANATTYLEFKTADATTSASAAWRMDGKGRLIGVKTFTQSQLAGIAGVNWGIVVCTDCGSSSTCAVSGSTGRLAIYNGTNWICP